MQDGRDDGEKKKLGFGEVQEFELVSMAHLLVANGKSLKVTVRHCPSIFEALSSRSFHR